MRIVVVALESKCVVETLVGTFVHLHLISSCRNIKIFAQTSHLRQQAIGANRVVLVVQRRQIEMMLLHLLGTAHLNVAAGRNHHCSP